MKAFWILISEIFIWALCIIGIMTIAIGAHEFYHYLEARNQNVTVESFCVYGFYDSSEDFFRHWSPSSDNAIGYVVGKEDFKFSETKAYIITIIAASLLTILFIYAYFIVPYKKDLDKNGNIT